MSIIKTVVVALYIIAASNEVLAQPLSDTMLNGKSRSEMASYFQHRSRVQKSKGYALLFAGTFLTTFGASMGAAYGWDTEGIGSVVAISVVGLAALGASIPILSSGAKARGRYQILMQNPDPNEIDLLAKNYKRLSRNNSIAGFIFLGGGLILPPILKSSGDPSGTSKSASVTSVISRLGILISIPFFMEASKNKGRLSILTRKEQIPTSFMQNTGAHRSIGIGIPIGK